MVVSQGSTTTTAQLSSSYITVGDSVTDTATVTAAGVGTVPTGNVRFYVSTNNGATFKLLGSAVALSGGQATSISYTPATIGTYQFKAVYMGSTKYADSTSNIETLTVSPFVLPEYPVGALSALIVMFGAFVAYKKRGSSSFGAKSLKRHVTHIAMVNVHAISGVSLLEGRLFSLER